MRDLIYVIPGWGFYADILHRGALADETCIGLDYFEHINPTVEDVVLQLSRTIKNQSTVVAWSLGGIFAIKMAYLFPDKVKKLILLASQPRLVADHDYMGIDQNAIEFFIDMARKDFNKLKDTFIDSVNFPNRDSATKDKLKHYFLDKCENNLISLLNILLTADLREDYRQLETEILHIIGGKDAVLKQTEHCLSNLNARVRVAHIHNAGHCGFLTHATQYQSLINQFIYD